MKRITKHLITTTIGCVVVLASLGLLYAGKIDVTGFTIAAGVGTALLFAKDDTFKSA
jgi:hypothetical protein